MQIPWLLYRRRLAVIVVVLASAAPVAVPAVPAQDDQDFLWDDAEIWEGPWSGHISATGDGVLFAQGIEFVYQIEVTGSLELEAAEEVVIGTFNVEGEYSMLGEQGGSTLVGIFDTVGAGEIIGTPANPS